MKKKCSNEDLLALIQNHIKDEGEIHETFKKSQQDIMDILKPISDAYSGYVFLGKFGWKIIMLLSIIIGTIITVKNNWQK